MVENVARLALWEQILQDEDAIKQLEADLSRVKERESDAKGRAFQLNVAYSKIEQLISEVRERRTASRCRPRSTTRRRAASRSSRTPKEATSRCSRGGSSPGADRPQPLGARHQTDHPEPRARARARDPQGVRQGRLPVAPGIAHVLPYPVLRRINSIRTRQERLKAFLVQATLASASTAFLVSVAYVTWEYGANDGKGLTRPVIDAIESFREMLS